MSDDLPVSVVNARLDLRGVTETSGAAYFSIVYFNPDYFMTKADAVDFGAPNIEVVDLRLSVGVL